MASGYKELAIEYRTKMQQAEARCFELEKVVAEASQTIANIKTEEGVMTQTEIDALLEQKRELEDNLKVYSQFADNVERQTGIPLVELASTFCEQRSALEDQRTALEDQGVKLENATSIEKALRKQAKNYENKWKQAEKLTETAERQKEKAQESVRKLEAALFREKLNTKSLKFVSLHNPMRTILTAPRDLNPASSPSTLVAATSSSRKRGACEDQDDEELDIKVKPKTTLETPVKQMRTSAPTSVTASAQSSSLHRSCNEGHTETRLQQSARLGSFKR
ncbi:hypothetical protein LTR15_000372 [Elasticomyces elasticus]|nr:hypothetical protein LTR15_000372 [Elasticomyces elasticus]